MREFPKVHVEIDRLVADLLIGEFVSLIVSSPHSSKLGFCHTISFLRETAFRLFLRVSNVLALWRL